MRTMMARMAVGFLTAGHATAGALQVDESKANPRDIVLGFRDDVVSKHDVEVFGKHLSVRYRSAAHLYTSFRLPIRRTRMSSPLRVKTTL